MLRQTRARIDRRDGLAGDVGEGIEFQPGAILLDHRNRGTHAALEPLAAVDPCREGHERTRQWLHLADAAAGVWVGEPEISGAA